jgi:hypothetical protein
MSNNFNSAFQPKYKSLRKKNKTGLGTYAKKVGLAHMV